VARLLVLRASRPGGSGKDLTPAGRPLAEVAEGA